MLMRNSLFYFSLFALSTPAFGDGDMLKPDEIQTTGVEANPAADSGMFIGGGLIFGQSRSTSDDVSPGTAVFFGIEPGYQARRSGFGRLEFSGQLLSGQATVRPEGGDATKVQVGFGLIFKAGIGHSLGDKLYGVTRVGLGPVMSKLEAHPDSGGTYKSDTATGLAGYIGWTAVAPISASLDFTGGVSWTHLQLGIDKVEDSAGNKYDIDNAIVNVPAVELGLRFRI